MVAPLDDEAALDAVFARHGAQIAAAIIEPLPANYGLLPQRREFLQHLAQLCRQHGALLIFDEVISGFRIGFQGCAGRYGFEPDLVTYGKVIGGGFPVGAYGGKRQYMELVAPAGPVYQAGTLSANPVAMCAGLATLQQLEDGRVYAQLEAARRAARAAAAPRVPGLHVQRLGSLFWLYLSPRRRPRPMRSLAAAPGARSGARFARRVPQLLDARHLPRAQRLRGRLPVRRAHRGARRGARGRIDRALRHATILTRQPARPPRRSGAAAPEL